MIVSGLNEGYDVIGGGDPLKLVFYESFRGLGCYSAAGRGGRKAVAEFYFLVGG
ncbi:hypothetical protein N185_17335 [Sinorhizobium sp. GW3]|nr:hypothetical protein N185_17335 [Sinorhizobium sp. GW3]